MESHGGHDLLVAGLSRPQDTVRLEAIRGCRGTPGARTTTA